MKRHQRTLGAVLVLLTASGALADDFNEYRLRSVWEIRFVGNQQFEAAELRQALALNGSVQRVADPAFELQEFDQAVCRRLIDGYRFRGFADAAVRPRRSSTTGQLTVQIDEGRRYRCGKLTIEYDAVTDVDVNALRTGLTTKSGAEIDKQLDTSDESLWQAEDFADLSVKYREGLQLRVLRLLREQGYHFAEIQVELVPEPKAARITLRIQLSDPGERQQVRSIRFVGHQRHTEAQLLQFLNLPPQVYVGRQLEQQIVDRLLHSGRFVQVTATTDTPIAPSHKVDLTVHLEEYKHAPLLHERLTDQQQILVRLADWFRALPTSEMDLSVRVTLRPKPETINRAAQSMTKNIVQLPTRLQPDDLSCELLLAGHGGGLARLTATRQDQKIMDISVLSLTHGSGAVDWLGRRKWINPEQLDGTNAVLKLEGLPDESEKRFRMFIGLGATSHRMPFRLRVTANPAALFDMLVNADDLQMTRDGDHVRFEFDESTLIVNATTGALVSASARSDNLTINVTGGRGLLKERLAEVEEATATMEEAYDPEAPASSLIVFAAKSLGRILQPVGQDLPPLVKLTMQMLQDQAFVSEAGERLTRYFGGDSFRIPAARKSNGRPGASDRPWHLHALKGLVPVESGPHRLISAILHAQETGADDSLKNLLEEIRRDNSHGPVTCLLTGLLMKSTRTAMASVGLKRIDEAAVPPEIVRCVTEPCLLSGGSAAAISGIRNLSDREFELLVQSVRALGRDETDDAVGPAARAVTAALQLIRHHPAEDPRQAAQELIALAWHTVGRTQVTGILKSWQPTTERSIIRPASARKNKVSRPGRSVNELELPDTDKPIFRSGVKYRR